MNRERRESRRRERAEARVAAGDPSPKAASTSNKEAGVAGKDLEDGLGKSHVQGEEKEPHVPGEPVEGRDLIALAQYHYNPNRDVVLRAEFISEWEFKVRLTPN